MALRFRYLLAVAFIAVALIPELFLSAWFQRAAFDNEMAAVREKHLLLASNMTAALERYAKDVEATFEMLSATAVAGLPLDSAVELAGQLGLRHFCLIGDDGRIERRLDLNGETATSLDPDVLERLRARADGGRLFGPVVADAAGRPTINLVHRLADGRIAFARLSTDYFIRLQQAIAFGRKGHAAIVDHQGNLLAHPNPDWHASRKNIAKVEPVRRMMRAETGVTTFFSPAMQRDMVSGFTSVPGVGWGVMVPQPIEELEERAAEVQRGALVVMLIGLITAGMVSWLIAGLLMRPIDAVVGAARQIARGCLTARVPAGSRTTPLEFRQLSNGFNAMAERIETDQKVMRSALSEAQLANRTKSEFLANMSHEFRTPLNAVIGFSDTMRQQVLGPLGNPRYREYVDNIHYSGQHLLAIINDILDLSKIEPGRLEIEDDVFDIAGMIEEALILIRPRAAEAELSVKVDVAPGLPPLRASKVKLKQILINLLANAVRFTPAGGRVSLRVDHAGDGGLRIRISDTGIGMTADEIALALQPFAQVDSKLSRKYEGTGLGLPLARRLIELHGGRLEIASQPDSGTTADVFVPADRIVLRDAAE